MSLVCRSLSRIVCNKLIFYRVGLEKCSWILELSCHRVEGGALATSKKCAHNAFPRFFCYKLFLSCFNYMFFGISRQKLDRFSKKKVAEIHVNCIQLQLASLHFDCFLPQYSPTFLYKCNKQIGFRFTTFFSKHLHLQSLWLHLPSHRGYHISQQLDQNEERNAPKRFPSKTRLISYISNVNVNISVGRKIRAAGKRRRRRSRSGRT